MLRIVVSGAIALCATGGPAWAETPVRREQAEAYAAGSQRLLYRETHWVLPTDPVERWVLYRCPDGRPFARKQVRGASAAPSIAFEDGRDGHGRGVRGHGAARVLYQREAGQETSHEVTVPEDGVIDAGFDAAVRAHWGELMADRGVRLRFLVPSRKEFFPVRVQRSGSVEWKGLAAERLQMRLATWFGFAVPEVTLVYARADRRLLAFTGTSDLRDARGRNPQVRIEFAPVVQEADRAEVAAMARLPLDGRCDL